MAVALTEDLKCRMAAVDEDAPMERQWLDAVN